jgi:hypothetical protein
MSQPIAFSPAQDYSVYQANHQLPGPALLGSDIDADFARVKDTTDQIRTSLALLQRDDGKMRNGSVHPDALSAATAAMIANWTPKGEWDDGVAYVAKDMVTYQFVNYVCVTAHTSDADFEVDLEAGRWQSFGMSLGLGLPIIVVATGNSAQDAINLQAGIDEASATLRTLVLVGTFLIPVPETVSWYLNKIYPVHLCVELKSNVTVDATQARFMMDTRNWTIPTTDRVILFGTQFSTTFGGGGENIHWIGGIFDWTETYGTGHSFAYGHGLFSVDNSSRQNVTHYSPPEATQGNRRGRGITARNCRNRSSRNMTYINTTQPYNTRYEYGVRENDLYATGYSEFYDADEVGSDIIIDGFVLQDQAAADDVFDLAAVSNAVVCNGVVDGAARAVNLYTKAQGSWTTFDLHEKLLISTVPKGTWATATNYAALDFVEQGGNRYVCIEAHLSGTFATDLAAIKWRAMTFDPTCTFNSGTDMVTIGAGDWHTVADGRIGFTTSGSLTGTGLAVDTLYYIIGSSITGSIATGFSFQVSTTEGGGAVDITGAGTGTHMFTRYPNAEETASCRNVTFDNVIFTRLVNDDPTNVTLTVQVGAYQDQFYRNGLPRQTDDIVFRNCSFDGGVSFAVNEGRVTLDNVTLSNFVPIDGATLDSAHARAALTLRQIISAAFQTSESWCDAVLNNVSVINSAGAGIICNSLRNLTANNVRVDGYNLGEGTDNPWGFYTTRLGIKAGVLNIGDIYVNTTVDNTTDMRWHELASVVQDYIIRQSGVWRLTSSETNSVNIACNDKYNVWDYYIFNLPSFVTTGPTEHREILLHGVRESYMIMDAYAVNHAAIVDQAANTTRLRLHRSVAGSLSADPIAILTVDGDAVTADTNRQFQAINPDSDPDCLIAPGETCVAVIDPSSGSTGSTTPKQQLQLAAFKFVTT